MKPTDEQIENRFRFHPVPPGPEGEARQRKHSMVTEHAIEFAKLLCDVCPDGRQLSLALTELESVRMRANASIAGAE